MSNTSCHKSPVIEARFFCKPERRSYPENRRVLHAQVLALQASSGYLESKTSRMNPDLYIYYYVIEKQTRDRAENCNQHSTRALACLAMAGVPKRRVGVCRNGINLWPYYYTWLFDFRKWRRRFNDVCRISLYSRYYDMGSKFVVTSCPGYVRTNGLVNVYSEINQKQDMESHSCTKSGTSTTSWYSCLWTFKSILYTNNNEAKLQSSSYNIF